MSKSILLVGSIPLASAEDVFRAVAQHVGPAVKRVPDGETGERSGWTVWQDQVMAKSPDIERTGSRDLHGIAYPTYAPKPGVEPERMEFGELGYAKTAKDSYLVFSRLRSEGINSQARFQVSLPTPLAVVQAFFWGSAALPQIWKAYERQLLKELDEIARFIPARDLSIQWDIAVEFHRIWEKPESELARQFPTDTLIEAIARISDHVPTDIELGWHFCYGDAGHKHFVEPQDTTIMTDIANRLIAATRRRLDWLHLPVPRERDDVAYFTGLAKMKLHKMTELYLGLIHLTDGLAGTKRRMAAADKVVFNYGIATECGFGRRVPETIPALLELHRAAAEI